MTTRISMLTLLLSAYFSFSLLGLIDASEYSYEELVQRMSLLEKKVDHRLSEKSTFQLRLSRQVKILESRVAEMMIQQAKSDRKQEILETRISQLEEQVLSNGRTIANQQSEINSIQGLMSTNKGGSIRRSFTEVPVAFTAVLDHDIEHSGIDQTVIFNKVLLNDGSAYNHHTGVFTVPKEGVYMFYLAFASGYLPHAVWMHIVVDGQGKVAGVADTLKVAHDAQGTNLVLLHLHKGDSVWVTTYHFTDTWGFEPLLIRT